MRTAIFNYPAKFVTIPEYTAHAGQTVNVIRPLIAGTEYDGPSEEMEAMFLIQASDGWEGHAFEGELE